MALSSQADTSRVWLLSGGWCCTGLPRGMADLDTCPPCDTGGLCGQVGRGRRRSPRGQCRWILGHRWQQHSHLGSLHSLCLPSHSHTHNGSCQPSSGRYPRFCSEGDSGSHIRPHLQSNPSLSRPLGRGRCRRPVHPGKYPRSDIGARHSHLNLPHSLGL